MARDRGSYKEQRRDRDGDAARGGPEDEDMFFGASPSEKQALRHTKEPKKLKLAELNLDGVDREKFGAPEKVGENMRLIDIAMGDSDPPAPPRPRATGPAPRPRPPEPQPEPGRPARRTPSDYVATGEQGEIQAARLHVQRPWRNRIERASWVLAVLIALLGLTASYALPVLSPELAVAAAAGEEHDPWGHAWAERDPGATAWSLGPDGIPSEDDLQRPAEATPLARWAAWAREAALLVAGALVWLALTLSLTLDLRSPSRAVEAVRVLLLASLPALAGLGALAWGAGLGTPYGLPHPPAALAGGVERLLGLSAALPPHPAAPWAAAWVGLCLLVAAGIRRARPQAQTLD